MKKALVLITLLSTLATDQARASVPQFEENSDLKEFNKLITAAKYANALLAKPTEYLDCRITYTDEDRSPESHSRLAYGEGIALDTQPFKSYPHMSDVVDIFHDNGYEDPLIQKVDRMDLSPEDKSFSLENCGAGASLVRQSQFLRFCRTLQEMNLPVPHFGLLETPTFLCWSLAGIDKSQPATYITTIRKRSTIPFIDLKVYTATEKAKEAHTNMISAAVKLIIRHLTRTSNSPYKTDAVQFEYKPDDKFMPEVTKDLGLTESLTAYAIGVRYTVNSKGGMGRPEPIHGRRYYKRFESAVEEKE